MKWSLLTACALVALAVSAPVQAQHAGHNMGATAPVVQSDPRPADHSGHSDPRPETAAPARAAPTAMDHAGHQMSAPANASEAANEGPAMAGMEHGMTGAFGSYPMSREASGTAWQPDASVHGGLRANGGDWTLMGHLLLNGAYDWQQGPRGGERAFVSGMAMGVARRNLGHGTLQFRAALSPDPLMGRRGYPLHLASGETPDGVSPLIDRQHPHDLFMELSASYSMPIGKGASIFVYGGLPGEPAFGPPAFMHRGSTMDSPEAPISHHWLDSTHITFGVLTAGIVAGRFKLEASRFNGREPDQHRYDIETGPLDSTALRLSWNPTPNLSLQASWAHLVSPEQLEPDRNSIRWSASAIYTRSIGERGWWSSTAAWGRRDGDDAFVLESAAGIGLWTVFGRGEVTENDELTFGAGRYGPRYTVGKVSVGAIRDFRIAPRARLGIGALYSFNFVPAQIEALYGGDPHGAMAFLRLRVE